MRKNRFLISLNAVLLWVVFIFCRSLQPADASTAGAALAPSAQAIWRRRK